MKGYALKISSPAIALIKKQQGLSLEKYRDERGAWVIGYGHVLHREENLCRIITPIQAEYLLHDDLHLCETLLQENISRSLTQQQHDALVMMVFSFGVTPAVATEMLQAVDRV